MQGEENTENIQPRTAHFDQPTAEMYVANCGRNYKKSGVTKMVQMPAAFTVNSKEGVMPGNPGDWLALDVDGDPYVIDGSVQKRTYSVARKSRAKVGPCPTE